jgi:hypothetical protein
VAEALAIATWQEQGILPAQEKTSNFIQFLQNMLDVNRDGIPLAYIDPTVIAQYAPYYNDPEDIPEDKQKEAIVKIEFEDGIPIANGIPLWERLDGEPIAYYKLFKQYRDMKYCEISAGGDNQVTEKRTIVGTRSMARLAEDNNLPGRPLSILARIYHWMLRVKLFDRQKEREIALKRQRQAEELESKHAKYSNEILEQAINYLKDHKAKLDPKVAVQMVELGMKYGRISVGLLGDKPGSQAAVAHQTNIAISQTQTHTHNEADQMVVAQMGGDSQGRGSKAEQSAVERQFAKDIGKPENLLSIIHILNKGGAFVSSVANANEEDDMNVFDEGDDIPIDESDVIDITEEAQHG